MKLQLRESKLNAYKHGLTAQTLILDPADKPAYDEHCKSYFDLYKPVGRPEQLLVHMIADDYWRCLRGRALETALMSRVLEYNTNLTLDQAEEKKLNNLTIYIGRIERSIRNNTKALKEMQLARSESDRKQQITQPELVYSSPEREAPFHAAAVLQSAPSAPETGPWPPAPGPEVMTAA